MAQTSDLLSLRARCEAWFAQRYEVLDPDRHDLPGLIAHTEGDDHDAPMREAQRHQAALWQAGFAGLTVPERFGGHGLTAEADAAVAEVAARYVTPSMVPLSVGLSLALQTLLQFAHDDVCAARVPRILDATEVWCQLFSEPEAGSDLASLRTAAVREGDGYRIDGQKVWTSFAQHSAYGLLLTRTGPWSERHRGLTLFVLPMDWPGVTVRPLREMTGGTHFNEVFLEGVVLPASAVLGVEGGGWAAAMFTLGNERNLGLQRARPRWKRLHEIAVAHGTLGGVERDRLAALATREMLQRFAPLQGSLGKLAGAQIEVAASELAADLLGADLMARDAGDPDGVAATTAHWFLGARANRLAGGTDEIQRNVIAERLLGLPR